MFCTRSFEWFELEFREFFEADFGFGFRFELGLGSLAKALVNNCGLKFWP